MDTVFIELLISKEDNSNDKEPSSGSYLKGKALDKRLVCAAEDSNQRSWGHQLG